MKLRRSKGQPLPWGFLALGIIATIFQSNPSWRGTLLYDRTAIVEGQWWRLWSGHLIHFGWPHFIADTGLFIILGHILRSQPRLSVLALLMLPAVISAAIYYFDPAMNRYGGLSAVDLSLLLVVAGQGWQRDWKDWFWPAILLIYIGEIVFESTIGQGHGGGMIRFDDQSIHVATSAHIAAACSALLFLVGKHFTRNFSHQNATTK